MVDVELAANYFSVTWTMESYRSIAARPSRLGFFWSAVKTIVVASFHSNPNSIESQAAWIPSSGTRVAHCSTGCAYPWHTPPQLNVDCFHHSDLAGSQQYNA